MILTREQRERVREFLGQSTDYVSGRDAARAILRSIDIGQPTLTLKPSLQKMLFVLELITDDMI